MFEHTDQLVTLRDWFRFSVSLFHREGIHFGHGSSRAYDEAAYLLLHTLRLPLDMLDPFLDARLLPAECAAIRKVLEARVRERKPAAYITGEAFLGEHRFIVDERVIIPRSYFLEVIPEVLPHLTHGGAEVRRVADVCTGSGCLAVLLAHQFPEAAVDAFELSPPACAVARLNIDAHGLEERIQLFTSDVLAAAPEDARYDLIVSNPPYEPEGELDHLPREYQYEPEIALVSGHDGLDVIRRLLPQAAAKLQPEGLLLMEVGGLRTLLEETWPELDWAWIATADGENCVCFLRAADLQAHFSPPPARARKRAPAQDAPAKRPAGKQARRR